jgi:hypothetical protein
MLKLKLMNRCKSQQEYIVPLTFIGTLRVRCGEYVQVPRPVWEEGERV